MKNKVMFLYGKLGNKNAAKYYCELHKCFLNSQNIFEKQCKRKKCKYRRKVNKYVI